MQDGTCIFVAVYETAVNRVEWMGLNVSDLLALSGEWVHCIGFRGPGKGCIGCNVCYWEDCRSSLRHGHKLGLPEE